MGTYLSTPVTEKHKEEGHSRGNTLTWGVVDMQGWRKTMEDAHIAQTDIPLPFGQGVSGKSASKETQAHIFGVFDGHGGPEVARFTALYLVSVLQQQLSNQQAPPSDAASSSLGPALVETFHALDRMIDDATRRDELVRLRAIAPATAEQRKATKIPPKSSAVMAMLATATTTPPATAMAESTLTAPQTTTTTPAALSDIPPPNNAPATGTSELKDSDGAANTSTAVGENGVESSTDSTSGTTTDNTPPDNPVVVDQDDKANASESLDAAPVPKVEEPSAASQDGNNLVDQESVEVHEGIEIGGNNSPEQLEDSENEPAALPSSTLGAFGTISSSAFALPVAPAVASDEAAANNSSNTATGKVTGMLQRLLKLSTPASGVVLQVGKHGMITTRVVNPSVPTASKPTVVRNGQMMCNLPDHPVHAGATAIVAVLLDNRKTLVVANAGDSRAVLCREGGVTVALSFDHKPMQATELARIRAAGGFVNAFGRVNGNLNLSRSIGDLKYKQVPGIPPALQMITAEPDIVELELTNADEFIILGCDGIWDCLTNEKAVEFVRSRIQTMSPTEIGVEMLKTIISDDPRSTQGIGGDNMTIMIVDLQPNQRSYSGGVSSTTQPAATAVSK